jgi:hypothetical protein
MNINTIHFAKLPLKVRKRVHDQFDIVKKM